MFPLHYSAGIYRKACAIKSYFSNQIIPSTNYTFPYSYLVTTSFQLGTYRRAITLRKSYGAHVNGRVKTS